MERTEPLRRLSPGHRHAAATRHAGFIAAAVLPLRRAGTPWVTLAKALNDYGRDDPNYRTFSGKPWTPQNLKQRIAPHANSETQT